MASARRVAAWCTVAALAAGAGAALYATTQPMDSEWGTYVRVVRTLALEALVVLLLWGYAFTRLASGCGRLAYGGLARASLGALFFSMWVPIVVVVVHPIGRWVPPGVAYTPGPEPPLFQLVGFASAAILLQVVAVTLVVDVLFIAAARSVDKVRAQTAALAAAQAAAAVAGSGAPPPQPQAGVQCAGADIDVEVARANAPPPEGGKATDAQPWLCLARARKWAAAHLVPRPMPPTLAAGALALTAAMCAWGFHNGLAPPGVVRVEVPLPRLPASLDGFRIVQLTDVHVGPSVGAARVAAAVAIANALRPDIVVITGDLTDASEDVVFPMLAPLAGLVSTHNRTYMVTGNHDYYEGRLAAKVDVLSRLGVSVLTNRIVPVPEGGGQAGTFDLLGVPDWAESRKEGPWAATDLPGAVAGRNASRELVVLAHQPLHAAQAGAAAAGLQLTGHVHCGQVLPLHVGTMIVMPYFRGLNERTTQAGASADVDAALAAAAAAAPHAGAAWRTHIYMSCGTYGWGPLFRQAAPHEVTLVVLRSAAVVGADAPATFTRQVCTGAGCDG